MVEHLIRAVDFAQLEAYYDALIAQGVITEASATPRSSAVTKMGTASGTDLQLGLGLRLGLVVPISRGNLGP